MRIPQVADQQDDLTYDGHNPISIYNKKRQIPHKKQKKSKTISIIGIIIFGIVVFGVIYYIVSSVVGKQHHTKELQARTVTQVQLNQKIAKLQARLEQFIYKQEEKQRKNTQNNQAKANVVTVKQRQPIHAQNKQNTQLQHPVKTQPQQNRKKQLYMTQELKKISEKRQQKPGRTSSTAKTVSQLQFFKRDKDGRAIQDVIYHDESARHGRKKFYEQRIAYLDRSTSFENLKLAKYNLKADGRLQEEEKKDTAEEYIKAHQNFNLDTITQEIPMCIVVPGYNNNAQYRLEYNLNSIFTQNYTNYFVVIINDASTDGSDQLFRKYLHFYNIKPQKYVYIENTQRKTALQNIYIATHEYCSQDSVVINLDGDDQFIGRNVLKMFNAGYQHHKAGVLYSNFYWYQQSVRITYGFTSDYTPGERQQANYRNAPQRFSHLRSYRTQLFRQVQAKDFQDQQGKFFTSAYDMAIYFPVLELSCGRVKKISGYHYLYNVNTGLNDYMVDRNKQATIDQKVRRSSKKYPCYEVFNKRMDNSAHG